MLNDDFRIGLARLIRRMKLDCFAGVAFRVFGIADRQTKTPAQCRTDESGQPTCIVCSVVIFLFICLSTQSEPDSAPKKIMAAPAFVEMAESLVGIAQHGIDAAFAPPSKI